MDQLGSWMAAVTGEYPARQHELHYPKYAMLIDNFKSA